MTVKVLSSIAAPSLPRVRRTLVAAALLLMVLPASAAAQSEPTNGTPLYDNIFSTSTSTTTTAVVVGGVVLTVALVSDSSAALEGYLEQNAALVQHDLYLGAGLASEDLAHLFGVPTEQHATFAALLFEEREHLGPLCDPETLSPERARAFASRVLVAMAHHPTLAQHLPAAES
ncbi:hypothetical protein DL240_13515 [Lujinxingia litoralis]|uniref:DUF3015 domain-containing protein n=1 Tax=Lujinxingia litoralis TaxID=2211119 RepID=A0A328C6Q0_9DELT|nr:hypothetical protein [Lujinxingia litoralis]RAL21147.1 hypothetical protein DL240_13515 [Lujinxingia litoralis]